MRFDEIYKLVTVLGGRKVKGMMGSKGDKTCQSNCQSLKKGKRESVQSKEIILFPFLSILPIPTEYCNNTVGSKTGF
jgi:hypothetical protein